MTLLEGRISDIAEESRRSSDLRREIEYQATEFVNSMPYLMLVKAKEVDASIRFSFIGEERIFKVLSQSAEPGKIKLYLGHDQLGSDFLELTLIPNPRADEHLPQEQRSIFPLELLGVKLVAPKLQ